jgi:hypothetical protein
MIEEETRNLLAESKLNFLRSESKNSKRIWILLSPPERGYAVYARFAQGVVVWFEVMCYDKLLII